MKRAMMLCGLMLVVVVACAPTPTATPVPPTTTVAAPTATRVPPTATPVPPSPTTVPPTATRAATVSPTAAAATKAPTGADCMATNTLEELVACVTAKMPRADTNAFVQPNNATLKDWKQVAVQMLAGKCDDIAVSASLKNIYTVGTFKDKSNNVNYCVALEVLDENKNNVIDRGWGTFIVNNTPSRELSIQVPHPLFDIATETQGIGIFKGTGSRTFLLAGTHRNANAALSTCVAEAKGGEANVMYNAATLFQATVEALAEFYKPTNRDWNALQFHGMGDTTCPGVDVFFSYGVATPPKPGDKVLELRANAVKRHPKWVATVAGEQPPCTLLATDSVQGRLLNDVAADQVCTVPAANYSGRFIYIEQKRDWRTASDWIDAINETWQSTIPVPPTRAPSTPTPVAAVPKATVNPNCAATNTLEELDACIVAKVPRKDTNGFGVPDNTAIGDWKQVAAQMLAGKCDDLTLPASLKNAYTISTFKDNENNSSYCVLMETLDENQNGYVDRGWGTFIVNNKPSRELSIQVPHVLYDIDTDAQGIGVFKGTNARSFLLAGAHRDANPARTTCEPSTGQGEADPAHNTAAMFLPTTQALLDYYNANGKAWVAIQFHGMGTTDCAGVGAFMTYGFDAIPKPGDKILELKANIAKQRTAWVVTTPGDQPTCSLTGGTNVQSRFLNGIPSDQVCKTGATAYSSKFIHIEQKRELRTVADWAAAINATWK